MFYQIIHHLVELPIPFYIVHAQEEDKFIKPSATIDAYKLTFYLNNTIYFFTKWIW